MIIMETVNNLEKLVVARCPENPKKLMTLSIDYGIGGSTWSCSNCTYNHYVNKPLQLVIPFKEYLGVNYDK